jgi:galactonate dehydratase
VVPPGQNRHFLFVRLDTEDPAICGLGEATLRVKTPAIIAALRLLEARVRGMSVFAVEELFYRYFVQDRWRNGVIMNTALSAVEMAMYDAAGKLLDVPVYNLLGGRVRDRVPLYVHGWGKIPQNVALGFEAFKTDPIPWNEAGHPEAPQAPPSPAQRSGAGPLRNEVPRGGVEAALEALARAREAAGPEVELLVECHGRCNADQALEFIRACERSKPAFVEEPIPPDDWNGWKRLARKSNVPLAGGERIFTRFGWRKVLEAGLLSIAQPDFTHCGGLMEAKKLSAMADACYVRMAPHNSSGPVATMASVHVDATLSNFYRQEFIQQRTFEELFVDPPRIEKGSVLLDDSRPGLGLVPDWQRIEAHTTHGPIDEGTGDW